MTEFKSSGTAAADFAIAENAINPAQTEFECRIYRSNMEGTEIGLKPGFVIHNNINVKNAGDLALQVTINNITGVTPYDIYICQGDGTSCFYMTTISTVPYIFDIPSPYDSSTQYMLKVIDNNGCVITGIEDVVPC